jgi:hypothetical protein
MKCPGTACDSARHCFPEAPEQCSAITGDRVVHAKLRANATMFDMAVFSSGLMPPTDLQQRDIAERS